MVVDIEKDAKELLAKAKKERGEPKGAPPASSPEKKTKEELEKEAKIKADKEKVDAEAKKKADAEAQTKKDEELLSKKDEELNEDDKKRKGELVKGKEKSNTQKRFDELTKKIKLLEKDSEAGKAAAIELADLKKRLNMTPEELFKQKIKEEGSTRITKYTEEDKDKPREERREMTKEELNDWITEDLVEAQEWISKRTLRRQKEEGQDKLTIAQNQSYQKVLKENPKMDFDKVKERGAALKNEGKTNDEIGTIIAEEFPECAMSFVVANESPHFGSYPNGPELIAKEVKRRLSKVDANKEESSKVEKLEKELAELSAENARLKGIDVSINSTRTPEPKVEESDMGNKLKTLASEVGLDPKKVADREKKRETAGYGR